MRLLITAGVLAMLLVGIAACSGRGDPDPYPASKESNGATFEIADAAVASNCLSLTFAVRGFRPPPDVDPQTFFPPAKSIDVRVVATGGELSARPLGGGGGGGGDEEDGRIWMEQGALYSLSGSVPEGEEVAIDVIVALDDDFASTEPLHLQIPVVAGPGGGTCQ